MSRVFITNEPLYYEAGAWRRALNLEPARQYGELVHLLPAGALPDDMRTVTRQIEVGMAGFTPDDMLILVGDPRAMAVAAVTAARRCDGLLRLLHWQKKHRCYDLVETQINNRLYQQ
jgi:hypothetical protein